MPRTRSTQATGSSARSGLDALSRRTKILEEEFLRRDVAREERLRMEDPALWQKLDLARRARNEQQSAINRRLRAEGLRPVALERSLAQRVTKLQQLEARNKAESAKLKTRS